MFVSYLFEAGWMFFAAWSVMIAAVVVAAFGRDFVPSKASQKSPGPRAAAGPGAGSLAR
jgi:hypothetical protein